MSELPYRGGLPSVEEIKVRVRLDDHTGVVALCRARLEALPDDAEALQLKSRSEQVLRHMYLARLGGLDSELRVAMSAEKLQWLSIDHRAGFLVSRIIEPTTVADLLAISSMDQLDTLKMLHELVQQKVIQTVR